MPRRNPMIPEGMTPWDGMPRKIWLPEHDKAFCMVPRCGSMSMRQVWRNEKGVERAHEMGEVYEGEAILWIRDPYDRLASVYNIFMRSGKRKGKIDNWTTGAFNNYDPHWEPQTNLHTPGVNVSKIYRFDDIAETWPLEFPGVELPWKHKTKAKIKWKTYEKELSKPVLDMIHEKYAEDLRVYNAT